MRQFITLLITVGLLSGCNRGGPIDRSTKKVVTGQVVVIIQPVGGFVGDGAPNNRFHSEGRLPLSSLSSEDRARVEALFSRPAAERTNFQYRITLEGPDGKKTVDAPPEAVPEALITSIHTSLD